MKGKLIVVTGIDGSGKTVQTNLLCKRLKDEGKEVELIDFPQYGNTFFADMIARYLCGEFNFKVPKPVCVRHTSRSNDTGQPSVSSNPQTINPYLTSLLYAGDRWECKDKIIDWLVRGKTIVSNRYVCCNKAYQGAKINNNAEKEKFFDWLNTLEHEVYGLPLPDTTIFLHNDLDIALDLIRKRTPREYFKPEEIDKFIPNKEPKVVKDIHEEDIDYLKSVQQMYLNLASREKYWQKIDCVENGKLLPKEEIAEKVWNIVNDILKPRPPASF